MIYVVNLLFFFFQMSLVALNITLGTNYFADLGDYSVLIGYF